MRQPMADVLRITQSRRDIRRRGSVRESETILASQNGVIEGARAD